MKAIASSAIALTTALLPAAAWAASGETLIPHWVSGGSTQGTSVFLTNISAVDVVVDVAFFDSNGNASTCPVTKSNVSAGNVIQAGKTARFDPSCSSSGAQSGIAKVAWSSNISFSGPALIGFAFRYANSTGVYSEVNVPVNDGKPF